MALTTEERLALETRLGEAKQALHQLEIGRSIATITYDGETQSYSAAERGSLRAYIRQLETELGIRTASRPRGRGVIFG
ncbi:gpW family head-tail joining protein [Martelella sp.]|uniref:gpW family head-tail joining protein n=1 Tax=Martelella sp. TaxID=1969699 RepID=UPI003242C87A